MTLNIRVPENTDLKPKIVVFGVGGAGGNAVNNMIEENLEGVEFVVANTDAQALEHNNAPNKIQLGPDVTEGLGAGAQPDVGAQAAEETLDDIVDALVGCHMCFITAGMGGGTGTGAAPIVARVARELGILTVGVVTKPFAYEGARRMRQAERGIEEIQSVVDTLIVIPNQNLFGIANEATTLVEAFNIADDVLYQGVKGVTDLMVRPGEINLDFADIKSVMNEMGKAMMGTGEAEGDDRALQAAERAVNNRLLDDISLRGARGVLINITGGRDLGLYEVDEAATYVREQVDSDANIIVGTTLDENMTGTMRVSVVATGIDLDDASEEKYRPKTARSEVERMALLLDNTMEEAPTDSSDDVQSQDFLTNLDNAEPDFTEDSDLPPPVYDAERSDGPSFHDLDDDNLDDISIEAPKLEESESRFDFGDDDVDLANEAAQSDAIDAKPEPVEEAAPSTRSPLKSLISRMSSAAHISRAERSSPSMYKKDTVVEVEKPSSLDDRDHIEVPAFLRRQAN